MSVTFSADDLDWDSELAVNMSNSNAATVASTLGIDLDAEGWCGDMAPQDFLGRVLVALALSPADEGMPSFQLAPGDSAGVFGTVREGGPTFIQGARRPGYLQERLEQLHELAEWAVKHNSYICYS
jgi:hypothetical protein